MRKLPTLLVAFTMLIMLSLSVLAGGSGQAPIEIFVNGNRIVTDKTPIIVNSRTLAPIRDVAEACGIDVDWNGEMGEVTLSYGFTSAVLSVGKSEMRVYNSVIDELSTVELEAAPVIIESSTYITIRPALEAMGAKVEWDGDTRSIDVTAPKNAQGGKDSEKGEASDEKEITQITPESEDADENAGTDDSLSQAITDTDSEPVSLEYTGFSEMKNHKILEHAPHGLYGRVKSDKPITLIRCRIVGTKMDYTLYFKQEDNLTNYNVFTYFDKLICFSDAGLGEKTFEVYAGTEGNAGECIFSYTYTVVGQREDGQDTDISETEIKNDTKTEKEETGAETETETEAEKDNSDENRQQSTVSSDNETLTDIPEDGKVTSSQTEKNQSPDTAISYYGFRKMSRDEIVEGAPHGLYGNVVSNYPLTFVRCRIRDTDMDYSIQLSEDENITSYNVFTAFDEVICFSDAGIGNRTFEIYAAANKEEPTLVFRYTYTVVEKSQAEDSSVANPDTSENTENIVEAGDVCLPLEGTIKVTSPYGFRAYNKWEFHKGVDIISESLNIICVADGTVVDCATGKNSGIGNYVAIQHEGGWVSLYYHLASYDVEIGDSVKKGQKIAIMGNTGGNYGVHLHFMTCDNWYGGIWATQNNHHKPPHEYVPQLLYEAMFYNPCYEKVNTDKMILCTFRFPNTLVQGTAYSISSSGAFVASENPLESLTLIITDENGNTVLSESLENPEYTVSGLYTYTPISVAFDMMCEFDKLPLGELKVNVIAVSELGRERIVYEKNFTVTEPTQDSDASQSSKEDILTKEEAERTDAIEAGENTSHALSESAESDADALEESSENSETAKNGTDSLPGA